MESSPDSSQSFSNGLFDTDPEQTLVLVVDFKRAGEQTFDALDLQLQSLRDNGYLSYWDGRQFNSRAVTVVVTGSIPYDKVMRNATYQDIFLDAPLPLLWEEPVPPIETSDTIHNKDGEIDYGKAMSQAGSDGLESPSNFNTSNSYYASTSFFSSVGFVWWGHLSPRQMRIIRGQIRGAKQRGLKVRYWDTPSWPTALRNHVWHVLVKEGADVLNVDNLQAAALQEWTRPTHDWL